MKTPYFVIHEDLLNDNVATFQKALCTHWANSQLAYSVKTNSLPWVLQYLHEHGVFAEVVSDEEYELAKLAGYKDSEIIFNGPIKGNAILKHALRSGAFVNVDSENDLQVVETNFNAEADIGVRVNLEPGIFEQHDIGYEEDGFRFGFAVENGELEKALNRIGRKNVGLHLHCNSVTRAKAVYVAIARYAASLIKKYQLEPAFIDMGGGFFGGVPGKTTADEYIEAICSELNNVVDLTKTKLIIEPGSAIIGSVVDLCTTVLDVKNTNHSRIVTTDGSRIHIDPLWIKNRYMYSVSTKSDVAYAGKQIICGYTCMDHDRLMVLTGEKELAVGDKIDYHRVGAYSMTFGGPFIRYFPEVYVKSGNELKKIRERITVEDYYRIQTTK